MSRDIDRAQDLAEREREAGIARARAATAVDGGSGSCRSCGCDIPAARLLSHPSAIRCVPCQNEHERGRR